MVRNRIKWPPGESAKKMSLDTMHISFIIEKDGHLSDVEVLGSIETNAKAAIIAAVNEYKGWTPTTYYGVPFRTYAVFPLKFYEGYRDDNDKTISFDPAAGGIVTRTYYDTSVKYYEKILDF